MVRSTPITRSPGERIPAKESVYDIWREGRLRNADMARVAGVNKAFLANLARKGRVPSEIRDGDRWYLVNDVLRVASVAQLPFSPLRTKEQSYLGDARWAWDALSLGPWNCPTAPSGRAWKLYLLAKEDPVVRRRLSRIHMDEASRELENSPKPVPDYESPADAAETETSEWPADEEEDKPLTVAEVVMRDLDLSKVAGPLSASLPRPEPDPPDLPDGFEGGEY